jgi:hypothetical protein
MVGIFLDWLLGPRCGICGQRVFPVDQQEHHDTQHAWPVP